MWTGPEKCIKTDECSKWCITTVDGAAKGSVRKWRCAPPSGICRTVDMNDAGIRDSNSATVCAPALVTLTSQKFHLHCDLPF